MGRPKAEKTIKTINSNFKNLQSPINLLSSMSEVDVKKISTGSLILDNILGGAFPKEELSKYTDQNQVVKLLLH